MCILANMNWVDLLAVIIMLRTSYISFKEGLSHEIFPLFGSVLSLLLALHFYDRLGFLLHSKVVVVPVSLCNLSVFLVIILAVALALKFLKILVDVIIKVTWHPLIEKVGGMLVGILRGAVAVSTILIFLALVPLSYLQWSVKDRSLSGMFFLRMGPAIYRVVSGGRIDDARIIREIISKKDVPADDKQAKKQPEWDKVFSASEKKTGGSK